MAPNNFHTRSAISSYTEKGVTRLTLTTMKHNGLTSDSDGTHDHDHVVETSPGAGPHMNEFTCISNKSSEQDEIEVFSSETEIDLIPSSSNSTEDAHANNRDHSTSTVSSEKYEDIVGSLEEHLPKEQQRRAQRFFITYEPTHKWWEPPLKAWWPDTNREILGLLILYNIGMTALARFTAFCGRSESDDMYFMICSDDYMLNEDHVISGLGVGLFLLLAFRANNSYERFWEGRRAWGRIKEVCRDLTRQICFEVHIGSIQNRVSNTNTNVNVDVDDTSSDEYVQDCYERRRAIAFVAAFAATLKLNMRGELNTVPELGGLLCFQDILNIEKSRVMPQFCVDVLTYYLQKQVRAGKLTVQEYCTMNETCLGVLADSMGTCERIRKTPIPLSYVLQLRVFLILWLCLYPLHLIGHYGWFTPLLATLVDFAVLGIESMACEIENPFGYHKNCIDLCSFCKGIVANVLEILSRVEHPDRDKVFNYQKVQERNTQLFSDGLTGPPLQDYKVITKDSLDFISEMEKKAI